MVHCRRNEGNTRTLGHVCGATSCPSQLKFRPNRYGRANGTAKVVEFLGTLGISVSNEDEKAASEWFNPNLRHQHGTTDDYAQAADVQREVFERLVARAGIHKAWESPRDLPEPQLWVDDVIRLRRQFQIKRLELKKVQGTRTFRVARSLKKIAKPTR